MTRMWLRWRLFRLTFTGRLHDWMFPSCRPDDEYDDWQRTAAEDDR